MARRIRLEPHPAVDELELYYRAAREPHERGWLHILLLLARGQSAPDVAAVTDHRSYWIRHMAKR